MKYSKEQLEQMMRAVNHIQTVLGYFTVPTSNVSKKMKYLKDMIQLGLDNAESS